MSTAQPGIFALGTASHAYLELDVRRRASTGRELVARGRLAPRAADDDGRRQPRRRVPAGAVARGDAGRRPGRASGFDDDVVGPDGFTMPATQHDAVLWISGSAYDVVFDVGARGDRGARRPRVVAAETSSWPYRHDLDLTGFIDGTENPTLLEAPEVVLVPDGRAGCGRHGAAPAEVGARRATRGSRCRSSEQERVIGRTKPDSVELDDRPDGLARRAHRPGGLRRDLPPEHALRHGHRPRDDVRRLLRRAAAARDDAREHGRTPTGVRDALTRFTAPLTRRVLLRSVGRRARAGRRAGCGLSADETRPMSYPRRATAGGERTPRASTRSHGDGCVDAATSKRISEASRTWSTTCDRS